MPTNLFRKVSLERLSSPEQLDKLLIIVKLRGWLALAILVLITISILAWSFLGQIPITATGKGILLNPRGLQGIYSRVDGRITRILARTGALVKKGDVLAIMENALFEIKFNESIQQLETLKNALKKEKDLYEKERELKQTELKKKMELEDLILENQKAKLALLEKQLSESTADQKNNLEKELIEQRNIIQTQLASIEIFLDQAMLAETNERIISLENEISIKQGDLKILDTQKQGLTITSPENGRVIEIDVMLGREVNIGTPMFWVQLQEEKKEPLPFYSFIEVGMGEKIEKGMPAYISLLSIDSQKYGQIEGKVLRVLPYAASLRAQQLAGIPSTIIREYLSVSPTSILVVIAPTEDRSTPSGYKWTTKSGPPIDDIHPGAIGTTRIILQSKKPIRYVLPILTE